MKKIVVLFLALFIAIGSQAQGIDIEAHGSLSKAIKRAQKEQKLVFVDCMASWCQPCKKLATEVFTLPDVGKYFNEHYVSIQLDMEKDADGVKNIKPWGIKSFPTMMFIDPKTGEPVGRLVGLVDGKTLIEAAENAFDPTKRIDNMVAQFNNGRHDLPFVIQLVKQLTENGLNDQVKTVMSTVLDETPVDTLATPQVWMLVMQFENDPLSKTLQNVKQNIDKFYSMPIPNAKEIVDAKLGSAALTTVMEFCQNPNLAAFAAQRYNDIVDYVAQMPDSRWKTACSVWLNTSMLQRKGNWQGMLQAILEVKQNDILQPQVWAQYFMTYIKAIPTMKDAKNATKGAMAMIDEMYKGATEDTPQGVQQLLEAASARGMIYQANGETGKLKKLTTEAQRLMTKLQEMGGANALAQGDASNTGNAAQNATGYSSPFASSTSGNPLAASSSNGNTVSGNTVGGQPTTAQPTTGNRLCVTLPYELCEGTPVVKVNIGGHTYRFLFDTCAGYTCVTDKLVNAESLPYAQTNNKLIGMQGDLTMAQIPQLMLGDAKISNATAAIMPESNPVLATLHADGIIGSPIISQFVVTFDSRQQTITLTNEADSQLKGWEELKFASSDPVITVKIKSSTQGFISVPMLFDSGNGSGSAALPSVEGFRQWRDNGLINNVEEGNGFSAMMITGMNSAGGELLRGNLNEYEIGDGKFTGIPVLTGGPAGYMIMCYRLTDLGRITLDYPNKRYLFQAFKDAKVWDRDYRPVLTGSMGGKLIVAAVYGNATKQISVGDEITAIGDKALTGNLPTNTPNIDVLIKTGKDIKTVTVKGKNGKTKELSASLFLSTK